MACATPCAPCDGVHIHHLGRRDGTEEDFVTWRPRLLPGDTAAMDEQTPDRHAADRHAADQPSSDQPVTGRRWVVGVDGSSAAVNALRWAVHRIASSRPPAQPESPVVVEATTAFHVPTVMTLFAARRGFGVDQLGIEATAAHDVDEAIEAVGDTGVDVTPVVEEGQAAHVLVEAAEDADLLVVGRRGSGDLRHHVLGSVSRYCATHADTPVVVVPTDWDATSAPDGPIVIGFDGSEQATEALRWALRVAHDTTSVRAVVAVDVAPWFDQDQELERYPDEIRAHGREMVAAIDAIDPDHRAQREVVFRGARDALSEASETASMVVVGSRGLGRVAAGLLGSVSGALLQGSSCPVVVVPHED